MAWVHPNAILEAQGKTSVLAQCPGLHGKETEGDMRDTDGSGCQGQDCNHTINLRSGLRSRALNVDIQAPNVINVTVHESPACLQGSGLGWPV